MVTGNTAASPPDPSAGSALRTGLGPTRRARQAAPETSSFASFMPANAASPNAAPAQALSAQTPRVGLGRQQPPASPPTLIRGPGPLQAETQRAGQTLAASTPGKGNAPAQGREPAAPQPATTTATREFLNRRALQQNMQDKNAGSPATFQESQGTQGQPSSRKGVRVRSGTKQNRAAGSITGRFDIGMEDTRLTRAKSRSTMALGNRSAYGGPNALAMQAQGLLPDGIKGKNMRSPDQETYTGGPVAFSMDQGFDEAHSRHLALLNKVMERSTTPLRTLNSKASAKGNLAYGAVPVANIFPEQGDEGAAMAVRTASHKRRDGLSLPLGQVNAKILRGEAAFTPIGQEPLGALAARFESGSEGIAAIGYDRNGGTSYGKFQISSRAGTMKSFLDYLKTEAPDLRRRLSASGPANTGGKTGGMPTEWKRIAEENPERFERLQNDFIKTSHFEPALQAIADEKGVNFEAMPLALQEVLFSTAVQHGPAGAVRIIGRAVDKVGAEALQDPGLVPQFAFQKAGQSLIQHIYDMRAGQFTSSTQRVQEAAHNRLTREMREALYMLRA